MLVTCYRKLRKNKILLLNLQRIWFAMVSIHSLLSSCPLCSPHLPSNSNLFAPNCIKLSDNQFFLPTLFYRSFFFHLLLEPLWFPLAVATFQFEITWNSLYLIVPILFYMYCKLFSTGWYVGFRKARQTTINLRSLSTARFNNSSASPDSTLVFLRSLIYATYISILSLRVNIWRDDSLSPL